MAKIVGLAVLLAGIVLFFWETPFLDFFASLGLGLNLQEIRFFGGIVLALIGIAIIFKK